MFLVEHKSTSKPIGPGELFWQHLTVNHETPLYLDAARRSGYPVKGVIYDVLRKPALRPKVKETPEEFEVRNLETIVGEPDAYLARGKTVRFDTESCEAMIDLAESTRAVRASRKSGIWPRHPHACERYGRMCDYFRVCSGDARIDDDERFEARAPSPTISKSSLEVWHRCPREFYFSKELGRRPRSKSGALEMGSALHKALEHWFKTLEMPRVECTDPFDAAKLNAMATAYAVRWAFEPWRVVGVETEFSVPIVNPSTGRAMRGVRLTGFFDAIIEETQVYDTVSHTPPSTIAAPADETRQCNLWA
jgi:hypothetical protein